MKNIKEILLLLAVALVTHKVWFVNFDVLTHGDWGYYYQELMRGFLQGPYIWTNLSALGSIDVSLSMYPIRLLWGLLSLLTDYGLSERILYFWPSLLIAALGSFYLAKYVTGNSQASVIGSFVFTYNTYLVERRGGHLTLAVAFALATIVILLFMKMLEKKSIFLLILTSLVGALLGAFEFRVLYIVLWILLFYYLYFSFVIQTPKWRCFLKNSIYSLLSVVLIFLLHGYWIIPMLNTPAVPNSIVFERKLFGSNFFDVLQSFTLFTPFWDGEIITPFIRQRIPAQFFAIPVVSILGLMLNKDNKKALFFGLLSLVGVLLTKQIGPPFVDLYEYLFVNLPGFSVFREASKFYFVIAISYSVLIASFISWIYRKAKEGSIKKSTYYTTTVLVAMLFLWNLKPVVTSSIGRTYVTREIPNDYKLFHSFIEKDDNFYRILWLPRASRWSSYSETHPKISGSSFVSQNFDKLIFGDSNLDKVSIENRIKNIIHRTGSDELLDYMSVKYVVVPIQDVKNDDDFYISYGKRSSYIDAINQVDYLTPLSIGTDELLIYENRDYYPQIYISNSAPVLEAKVDAQSISYESLSSTEYLVQIEDVSEPVYLNLSEQYHPSWNVKLGSVDWMRLFTNNNNEILHEEFHINNGLNLNSFYIDPEKIKSQDSFDSYSVNPDGTLDITLSIYFDSQKYVYLGSIISIFTLIGLTVLLAYFLMRRLVIKSV